MKKSNRSAIILIAGGATLIIAALSFFIYNRKEEARAAEAAKELLPKLQLVIEDHKASSLQTQEPEKNFEPVSPELTEVEIDGYSYVGYLSIPVLGLELPVMSLWDYERLRYAPCRQFGSSKTDDLVIAGHNYQRHFGYLSRLQPGDTVTFTDMDGAVNKYKVVLVDVLSPTDVQAVQKSGYDLALYTCTYSGKTRVTVFCERIYGLSPKKRESYEDKSVN